MSHKKRCELRTTRAIYDVCWITQSDRAHLITVEYDSGGRRRTDVVQHDNIERIRYYKEI